MAKYDGKTTDEKLKLPDCVRPSGKGTTGTIYPKIQGFSGQSPSIVKQYIDGQAKKYGKLPVKYTKNSFDCEDYCFLAAADVRRAFIRQPIGVVLGRILDGGKWQWHAVNILWYQNNDKIWTYSLYDTTFKRDVSPQNFEVHVVIPIPIGPSQDKKDYVDIPPKTDGFQKTAGYVLDDKGSYKFDLIGTAKEKLKDMWNEHYPGTRAEAPPHIYYHFNDTVFYWFAHIRQEFPGQAIGVAFGARANYAKNYGALILWESEKNFTYWCINDGKEFDDATFKPRVVIA